VEGHDQQAEREPLTGGSWNWRYGYIAVRLLVLNTKGITMRNIILPIVTVLGILQATAQTNTPAPVDPGFDAQCLLATTTEEWVALGLTTEEVEKAKAIQTECKTDCVAVEEHKAGPEKLSAPIVALHRERLREMLGEERYQRWLTLCAKRPSDG
jgi:hypothetical protein